MTILFSSPSVGAQRLDFGLRQFMAGGKMAGDSDVALGVECRVSLVEEEPAILGLLLRPA